MSEIQQAKSTVAEKLTFPTLDNIKTYVEKGLATLQLVPYGDKIKTLDAEVPHADLSDIDSFVGRDGQRLYGVVPDRADPARVHFYKKDEAGNLVVDSVASLKDLKGEVFANGKIDAESIRFFQDQDGKIKAVITSEGESIGFDKAKTDGSVPAAERVRDPKIYICDLEYNEGKVNAVKVEREVSYPEHYLNKLKIDPADPKKSIDLSGARSNASFESVAVTKDNQLVLITEFPLAQDGANASTENKGLCRMLMIDLKDESKVKEFVYEIDKVPVNTKTRELLDAGGKVANQENGVVSLYPHPNKENTYLVMERSFIRLVDKDDPKKTLFADNSIRLYEAKIQQNTTDVSGQKSIEGKNVLPLDKNILLDFENLKDVFSKYGVRSDNFEGMTLNFNDERKAWEMIFVSDNNSNKIQGATQILKLVLPESLNN